MAAFKLHTGFVAKLRDVTNLHLSPLSFFFFLVRLRVMH